MFDYYYYYYYLFLCAKRGQVLMTHTQLKLQIQQHLKWPQTHLVKHVKISLRSLSFGFQISHHTIKKYYKFKLFY